MWMLIITAWASAMLGFGAGMILLANRPLIGWVEPFPGEHYLVDGRMVTVEECRGAGVKARALDGQLLYLRHRYWKRHARQAAVEPGKLLELHAHTYGGSAHD